MFIKDIYGLILQFMTKWRSVDGLLFTQRDVITVSVRHMAVLTKEPPHVHISTYGSFSLSERQK
jgi:hypothetical protein